MKVTPAIESSGYGLSGNIGGLPRQTYYTPDGRVIKAIPCLREYAKKKNGKVIETGTRDANYDKGWLPVMPTELKLYCSGCDKWHDTQGEIDACISGQRAFIAKHEGLGRKEVAKEQIDKDIQITKLYDEIQQLKVKMEEVLNVGKGIS